MYDKRCNWLIAVMLVGLLAACSDDTTSSSSSSGGGTTDAGASSSSGGASSGGSSSGGDAASSSGGDAASSSGGGACTPKYATPTMDWGKGCTDANDAKYLKGLETDPTEAKAYGDTVKNCTTGCAGSFADEKKGIECIGKCISDKGKLSADCGRCYGVSGYCGYKNCLTPCLKDPLGKGCSDCRACHCTPAQNACKAGKK